MMFRLFILAILTMLSVSLIDEIVERQAVLKIKQRVRYIQNFERDHLQYFEFSERKEFIEWDYEPFVYFVTDPPEYDL